MSAIEICEKVEEDSGNQFNAMSKMVLWTLSIEEWNSWGYFIFPISSTIQYAWLFKIT